MKFKTTKKAIMANYVKVIEIGYCDLQYLLNYKSPIAYTAGVYGWNADIYDFGGVAIVTGYKPFGNIHPNWEIVEKYEKEAMGAYCRHEDKLFFDNLLKKFIEEVLKNDQKRVL